MTNSRKDLPCTVYGWNTLFDNLGHLRSVDRCHCTTWTMRSVLRAWRRVHARMQKKIVNHQSRPPFFIKMVVYCSSWFSGVSNDHRVEGNGGLYMYVTGRLTVRQWWNSFFCKCLMSFSNRRRKKFNFLLTVRLTYICRACLTPSTILTNQLGCERHATIAPPRSRLPSSSKIVYRVPYKEQLILIWVPPFFYYFIPYRVCV